VPGVLNNASIPLGNTTLTTLGGTNITAVKTQSGLFIVVPNAAGNDETVATVVQADIPFEVSGWLSSSAPQRSEQQLQPLTHRCQSGHAADSPSDQL
jgi:hypothetical protein